MKKLADTIDWLIRKTGDLFAWTLILLMAAIVVQVVLRYCFNISIIKLEEVQWHLHAMGMMIGLAYALQSDSHIRVDLCYQNLSPRLRAVVDMLGITILLVPFVVALFWYSLDFVRESYRLAERSNAPTGLPCRWIIKSFIPLGCGLTMLAAMARFCHCIEALQKFRHSEPSPLHQINEPPPPLA